MSKTHFHDIIFHKNVLDVEKLFLTMVLKINNNCSIYQWNAIHAMVLKSPLVKSIGNCLRQQEYCKSFNVN